MYLNFEIHVITHSHVQYLYSVQLQVHYFATLIFIVTCIFLLSSPSPSLSPSPLSPSQVYLGRHKSSGIVYAIKVLQKKAIVKRNEVKHIMAERNVLLRNVQHPFLVGLHYSFQTSSKLYFVLDYVNGGELFFHLQRERVFDESRARYSVQCSNVHNALQFIHVQMFDI